MTTDVDVVVVGGGAAGLSAAVTLGRARRSVLVVDAGSPRNAPADGVHNFLSRDGVPPWELVAIGREEVARYGGEVRSGTAVAARVAGEGFEVDLGDGSRVRARRLVVASGLVDELPDVPGLREQWGAGVVHCPYCHGWEIRDRAIGVLGSGPMAVHQALLFRQWSADVILFLHTAAEPTAEETAQLAARGVGVVRVPVAAIESDGAGISGVRLADGAVVARQVIVVGPRMVASSPVLDSLGLRPVPHPMGVGESYPADATGLTAVPGVWVAGNVGDLQAQVITAAAQGVFAGAAVNSSLITEETVAAVAAVAAVRG
jgi:thioredoxin reductase